MPLGMEVRPRPRLMCHMGTQLPPPQKKNGGGTAPTRNSLIPIFYVSIVFIRPKLALSLIQNLSYKLYNALNHITLFGVVVTSTVCRMILVRQC